MNIGIIALHMDPWRSGVDAALHALINVWRNDHDLTVYHSSIHPKATLPGVTYTRVPAIPFYRLNIEATSYAGNWRRMCGLPAGTSPHEILYCNHPALAPYDALTVQFCALDYLPILKQEWPALSSMAQRIRYLYRRMEYAIAARMERRAYGNPASCRSFAVHAVSPSLARALSSHFPHLSPVVIPNPLDASRFDASPPVISPWDDVHRNMGWPGNAWRHLFVGGGWERKGLAMAIESLRFCGPDTVLTVIGRGPVEHYQSLARRHGVETRVYFAGTQTNVQDWLHGANLFVFPSTYESMAIVCVEALACGCPILCTPFKGTELYLDHGRNGFVVNGAADIGTRSEQVKRDPALYQSLKRQARLRAGDFATPVVAARMMDFLQEARRQRGRSRP
jgi:glycosyltransferase involved in cell wall biosynthesis